MQRGAETTLVQQKAGEASPSYWLHIGDNPQKVRNCNTFWPLGKDEVASSNLASSSKRNPKPFGFGFFANRTKTRRFRDEAIF